MSASGCLLPAARYPMHSPGATVRALRAASQPIIRSSDGAQRNPRRTMRGQASASAGQPAGQPAGPLFGVHALVWEGGWSRPEVERAVAGTKRAGYDIIEVPLLEPATVDAAMTRAILEEHGLGASSSLGLSFDTDVSSEDAGTVERGKALLRQALKATHGFGGQYMVGVIYSALGKYGRPATAANRHMCANSMREMAVEAADLGITLGLEVINRYETNVLNTAVQAMELLADIDRPNVVVHLDTYHMNIEERSMQDAVAVCGDKLGYVHIGESHRGHLGTGSVDFQGFFEALARSGYSVGPITFESFSSRVVSPSLSNNLCVWRDLWDDSEDLATHARQFMGTQWKAACIKAGREF